MTYLQGKRIRLRAAEPEDLELLYRWENNTDIWQVSETLVPFSKYNLRRFLETNRHDIFETRQERMMIDMLPGTGDGLEKTIGSVDLYDFDPFHSRIGVGILIAVPEYLRQGYALEALETLTPYGKDVLQLHQLYAYIAEDNAKSIALFKKAGYSMTGSMQSWIKTAEGYKDQVVMQYIFS